jgi:uroporphyrinogen-III synthase
MDARTALDGFVVGIAAGRRADALFAALERRGARVRHAVVAGGPEQADALLDAVAAHAVDAVAVTGAPAARALLARAGERGMREALLRALRTGVLAVCADPAGTRALEEAGGAALACAPRTEALVALLASELPARSHTLSVAGHRLELRARATVVDGVLRALPADGATLLRTLAGHPGQVVSRSVLLRAVPGEQALDRALAGLRLALGVPGAVVTVPGRGHRLAVDPGRRHAPHASPLSA